VIRTTVSDIAGFKRKRRSFIRFGGLWWFLGGACVTSVIWSQFPLAESEIDYDKVRDDIKAVLQDAKYDDGSYAPVLIRLAWHSSGTFDRVTGTGGSNGALMRFPPESAHGANAGLEVARSRLEPIKAKYPSLSYSDLWTLAGVVGVESMGGPKISWRPGRSDKGNTSTPIPDGRLPDASKGPPHIRDIFGRMGFNDQEMVALIGAHAVGRCHADRSGFSGPWTNSPTMFTNDFYTQLLERKWTVKKWNGPKQFEDETKTLMMLPGDLALVEDPAFKKWVQIYADDEERWQQDFANAFSKLLELGVKFK